jgi:phospholipid N-methyltransferase
MMDICRVFYRIEDMKKILQEKTAFLRTAVKDRDVGAVMSSSRYVVRQVLDHIVSPPRMVLEYGAGDGVMTQALLSALSLEGTLIAIESNPSFCQKLEQIQDSRLTVFQGTVQDFFRGNLPEENQADLIVSSIPFSFLKPRERTRLIEQSAAALSETGQCIIFHQYSPLMKKYMHQSFDNVSVGFEIRNVLPCFIIRGKNTLS